MELLILLVSVVPKPRTIKDLIKIKGKNRGKDRKIRDVPTIKQPGPSVNVVDVKAQLRKIIEESNLARKRARGMNVAGFTYGGDEKIKDMIERWGESIKTTREVFGEKAVPTLTTFLEAQKLYERALKTPVSKYEVTSVNSEILDKLVGRKNAMAILKNATEEEKRELLSEAEVIARIRKAAGESFVGTGIEETHKERIKQIAKGIKERLRRKGVI